VSGGGTRAAGERATVGVGALGRDAGNRPWPSTPRHSSAAAPGRPLRRRARRRGAVAGVLHRTAATARVRSPAQNPRRLDTRPRTPLHFDGGGDGGRSSRAGVVQESARGSESGPGAGSGEAAGARDHTGLGPGNPSEPPPSRTSVASRRRVRRRSWWRYRSSNDGGVRVAGGTRARAGSSGSGRRLIRARFCWTPGLSATALIRLPAARGRGRAPPGTPAVLLYFPRRGLPRPCAPPPLRALRVRAVR